MFRELPGAPGRRRKAAGAAGRTRSAANDIVVILLLGCLAGVVIWNYPRFRAHEPAASAEPAEDVQEGYDVHVAEDAVIGDAAMELRDEEGDGGASPGDAGQDTQSESEQSPTKPAPLLQCRAILPKHLISKEGVIEHAGKLPVRRTGFIFSYNDFWRYAHMSMLETVHTPSEPREALVMMAAWQAAPGVKPDVLNRQVMAVEGLQQQRILYSLSFDRGLSWTEAAVMPTHDILSESGQQEAETAQDMERPTIPQMHAVWSPVLHSDPNTGRMHIFYSEAKGCWRPTNPPTWEPGGDIKMISVDGIAGSSPVWSKPRTLLNENDSGSIPKVIANKLEVLPTGEWVLPYWREQPRFERIAGFENFQSRCHASSNFSNPNVTHGTHTGVLITRDKGRTWTTHGNLTDPRTDLIEGTLARVNGTKLKMLLRTNTGCTFSSTSVDRGRTWAAAEPVSMPNPNSKLHMTRLEPSGDLVVAFNNHHRSSACKNCRTHLHVVVSRDGGVTWRNVATLEDSMENNVRVHYPTLLQSGTTLFVAYSRFYLGRCRVDKPVKEMTPEEVDQLCPGLKSADQGIKIAEVDLTHLDSLPQMRLPGDGTRSLPNKRALYGMLHHFVETEVPRNMNAMGSRDAALGILVKLRQMKWKDIASILALIYDLDYAGGARFLRARKGLGEMFKSVFVAHQDMLRERYVNEREPVHAGVVQVHRIEHAEVQSYRSTAIEGSQTLPGGNRPEEAGADGWVGVENAPRPPLEIAVRPMDAGKRRRLLAMLGEPE